MTYRQARQGSLTETNAWLHSLEEDLPFVGLEKDKSQMYKICERARTLLDSIDDIDSPTEVTLSSIREICEHDRASTSWRRGPNWAYKTINRSQITQDKPQACQFPLSVQLHQDIWVAYEWNYHRTGRMILHRHLLESINRLQSSNRYTKAAFSLEVFSIKRASLDIIQTLADEVLSTVPQSLGDIDHDGKILEDSRGAHVRKGIGGYFLLWPIKIIKSLEHVTLEQRNAAQAVFERIRECTGMKATLGGLSNI
jgi:hypothetical protein